ncbi:MBL fold metallo-hydrolase [Saccharicrinis sp. FJH2]|uniref:MBL fold metallo-hydrolase n=1 Tax=Saccharicrinis sp. FJH65 TaxID=3344659 RepID=UPI0035F26126
MNNKTVWFVIISMISVTGFSQKSAKEVMDFAKKIEWFGQASIKILFSDKTVYIDPYKLPGNDTPDVVFITHSHGDHLDVNEIAKLNGNKVLIVAPETCESKLREGGFDNLVLVKPGDEFDLDGIAVKVVHAYNIVKVRYHPKANNWVGYVLTYDGVTIYHPGDTERIPEMKGINCDIAFMPLGQTYTMSSVKEAAEAVKDVGPIVAIPFHYGLYEGKVDDAQMFKSLLNGSCDVLIKDLKVREL